MRGVRALPAVRVPAIRWGLLWLAIPWSGLLLAAVVLANGSIGGGGCASLLRRGVPT